MYAIVSPGPEDFELDMERKLSQTLRGELDLDADWDDDPLDWHDIDDLEDDELTDDELEK